MYQVIDSILLDFGLNLTAGDKSTPFAIIAQSHHIARRQRNVGE